MKLQQKIVMSLLALLLFSGPLHAAKSFVYCSEGSPSNFNPQIATDGPSLVSSGNTMFNRLVDFKKGTTMVVPSLAKSWSVSRDGKKYTFKLRKGVKFHSTKYFKPSRDFNADDVLFSFNRQRDKSHPYNKVSGGNYEYYSSMEMDKIIADIRKLDDYTVEFKLNMPNAPFIPNLAMHFASIHSKEYADQLMKQGKADLIDSKPIGTGPFVFNKYMKDTIIRYSAHPDYFGGKSKIAKLIFVITPDASVRFQKLRKGECDLVTMPSPSDLEAMKNDPNITVLKKAGLNVGYVAMNVEKKPFNNRKVRQAINYALNRNSYIDAIYLGHAQVAKNPIPPTMWSYNKKIKDYSYNIAVAKKLLAEAGFPNGFETDLWTLPVTRPYNPNGKKMGEMIQADLAKVGIKIKLVSYDWGTYLKKARMGEHAMIQLGWSGDNGDPDNFMGVLLGCAGVGAGSNTARWCDKSFDKLIAKARSVSDVKKRSKMYSSAQVIFNREAPWATIAHSTVYRAVRKNVSGFEISAVTGDRFDGIDKE